jgi:hypothetical protein
MFNCQENGGMKQYGNLHNLFSYQSPNLILEAYLTYLAIFDKGFEFFEFFFFFKVIKISLKA